MAYEELRALVESMGGMMRFVKKRMSGGGGGWVIVIGDWVGVFPFQTDGETTWFPDLNDFYDADWKLLPDALKRLFDVLEATSPLK